MSGTTGGTWAWASSAPTLKDLQSVEGIAAIRSLILEKLIADASYVETVETQSAARVQGAPEEMPLRTSYVTQMPLDDIEGLLFSVEAPSIEAIAKSSGDAWREAT